MPSKRRNLEQDRQLVLETILRERQHWEQSGRQLSDYLADREGFYTSIKKTVFPRLVESGVGNHLCDQTLLDFAYQDWVQTGHAPEEFRREMKGAKKRRLKLKILGAILGVVVAVVYGVVSAPFVILRDAVVQTVVAPTEQSVMIVCVAAIIAAAIVAVISFLALRRGRDINSLK
jgi:hypothetical protein